ncbi:MAG: hypothetical protein H6Q76_1501 [Firmicutes bacterium]|nr:hypothetical protein [Bacillota bacterium]
MKAIKGFGLFLSGLSTLVFIFLTSGAAQAQTIRALDPRGIAPAVERIPLSQRLARINGARICIVMSWPTNSAFDNVVKDLVPLLKERGAKEIAVKPRNVRYSEDDPQLWDEMRQKCDAFIYVAAPSSSTTSYAFQWSAKLEKMGLPGAVVNFDDLNNVGDTTSSRWGAALRRSSFIYPPETMNKQAYAAALSRAIDNLTRPLTPDEKATGIIQPKPRLEVFVSGDFDQILKSYYDAGMTDGLPIIPPTAERVAAMLKCTSHKPDEIVAQALMPEGLGVTVKHVAINAVMAGCLPEQMPVLLATIEAYQKYNLNSILRSTNSFSFMQVVNGPIAQQLKMNSGTGALSPGNQANASMGRALRLFIINLGGGAPGVNLMAVIGNVSSYSFMFAENEKESPWEPLSVGLGYQKNDNTLTFFMGGWAHSGNYGLTGEVALDNVAQDISRYQMTSGAAVIISPKFAQDLQRRGMSKADVESYLQKHSTRTPRRGRPGEAAQNGPASVFPEGSVKVIVAGGDASSMMQAWSMYRPLIVSIDKWR